MGAFTLVRALPKSDAKRVHPFLTVADHENSVAALESGNRLSNPSAQWFTASLDVILSAYANIHPLANSNSKWVNDALEDIVKLLDMCNIVSDNIADVKQYQKLLQSATHTVDHSGMNISKMSQTPLAKATNMLAECRSAITNVNAKCNPSSFRSRGMVPIEEAIASSSYSGVCRSENDLSEDMRNLNDCTSSVLKTVAKALSVELPRPFPHGRGKTRVLAGRCSRLRSLFERVRNHNGRCKSSRFVFHELENADVLVRKLHDILLAEKQQKAINDHREVRELVDALKECVADFDEGIAAMDNKVKQLYNALIRIRVKLLDNLTYSL